MVRLSRRAFVEGTFSTGFALAGLASTFSPAQATTIRSGVTEMMDPDQDSRGARLIYHTFARHCRRTSYRPILDNSRNVSQNYTNVTREIRESGFAIRDIHGYPIGNDGLVAIDGGDTLGVASDLDGCINTVLPPELGAFLSMHDEDMGLPAYFSRNGHTFTSEAALRYATPYASIDRRDLCTTSYSRFVGLGQGKDRCAIKITPKLGADGRPQGTAHVEIESPKGKTLEHSALPTDPSAIPSKKEDKVALGNDWRLIG